MGSTSLALLFIAVSNTFSLPPGLLSALCFVESSHNPKAVNVEDGRNKSLGMCQVKLATAKMLGFPISTRAILDPQMNIYLAGKYLRKQLNRYDENTEKAVAAYNAGKYRADANGRPLNKLYVAKVMKAWKQGR